MLNERENNGNWIKLYRKMKRWEWYDDIPTKVLFIELLLTVNIEDKRWHGMTIHRGEIVTSTAKLAAATGLSAKQIRRALSNLEKTGEIRRQRANKGTLIIVENYRVYQDKPSNEGKQRDTQRVTQRDSQRATTKEYKEYKEYKNISPLTPLIEQLPGELQTAMWEYVDHRKQLKAPFSELACKKLLNKLQQLSAGDTQKAIAILDQSIQNGWKGIFELKENKSTTGNKFLDLLAKEQI